MTIEERTKQFLIGLERLTRETGMVISGCGCCGSPSVEGATPEQLADARAGYAYPDILRWVAPSDEYEWESYASEIAKPGKPAA